MHSGLYSSVLLMYNSGVKEQSILIDCCLTALLYTTRHNGRKYSFEIYCLFYLELYAGLKL